MNEWKLLAGGVLLFLFLVGSLKLLNYKKEMRYLQFWSPLTAIILSIVVLSVHVWLLEAADSWMAQHAPDLRNHIFVFLNLAVLAAFFLVKAVARQSQLALRWLLKKLQWLQLAFRFVGRRFFALLPRRWRDAIARKDPNTVFLFFEKAAYQVRLKPEWLYPGRLLNKAAFAAGAFVAIVFAIHILPDLQSYSGYVPEYPVLSLLIAAECAWFLSGARLRDRRSGLQGKEEASYKEALYHSLFNEYRRLWPKHLLYNNVIDDRKAPNAVKAEWFLAEPHNEQTRDQMIRIREHLAEREIVLNESLQEMLHGMLTNRHLLVRDGVFTHVSKAFFPALYRMLLNNRKFILVVESESELQDGLTWFREGLEEAGGLEFAWTAAALSETLERNWESDLLIVRTHELLQDSLIDFIKNDHELHHSEISVLILRGDKMLSQYSVQLHMFANRLKDLLGMEPQYIVFSNWAEDLEDAMQKVFGAAPIDITVQQPRSSNIYYLAFASERGILQQELMPRMVHRVLDAETVLLLPALKFGVENIKFVHFGSVPGRDNMEELIENLHHAVQDYDFPGEYRDTIRMRVELHERIWTVPVEDHTVIICRDASNNLIHTLGQWWSSGKMNTLAIAVSPPYLLRDYLAAHATFFLQNHRKIAPIVPKPVYTKKSAYLYLMDRLSHALLTEEQMHVYLRNAGIEDHSVWEGMRSYAAEMQGSVQPQRDVLEVLFRKRFDRSVGIFKDEALYRLNAEEMERHKRMATNEYTVRTHSGRKVAYVQQAYIYQKYLPGQVVAFDGRWYRIQRIDHRLRTIELAVESLTGPHLYKQSRTYVLRADGTGQPNGLPAERIIDRFQLTFRKEFRSFDVLTNGYFDFEDQIDLYSDKVVYVPVHEEDQAAKRSYLQGNVLIVEIRSQDREFEDADRLAFTICYLLNELFVTLYPYNHPFLSISTPLPEAFFTRVKARRFSERLRKYTPQLQASSVEGNAPELLRLYVFEDSQHHLGLIESIIQQWDHLLELLDDYLYWMFEEDGNGDSRGDAAVSKSRYIFHGSSRLPEALSFEQAAKYIRRWLPEPTLRSLRAHYYQRSAAASSASSIDSVDTVDSAGSKMAGSVDSVSREDEAAATLEDHAQTTAVAGVPTRHCDFCGEVIHAAEFERLDDGRERCLTCKLSSVRSLDQLRTLYERVRKYFQETLKQPVREDLEIFLLTAGKIQERNGVPFVPTPEFDSRICGQAIKQEDGSAQILIENGSPAIQTLATLAHELTHIWQYDKLQTGVMEVEELEGHASWTEIHLAELLGARPYAEKLRSGLLEREDVYGRGYRALAARLEEHAESADPFTLYLAAYGRSQE